MRTVAATLAFIFSFGVTGSAAQLDSGDRVGDTRASVERLTLLPGPHLLSPAGSSAPGHHWRTVIAVSTPSYRGASAAAIESAKARLDAPAVIIRPLTAVPPFDAGRPPAAPTLVPLELPKLEISLRVPPHPASPEPDHK